MSAPRSGVPREEDAAPLHRRTAGADSGAGFSARAGRPGRRGRSIVSVDPGSIGAPVRWALGIAFALVAMALIALFADVMLTQTVVHPGVSVSGVDIGGLTPAAARAKLEPTLGKRYRTPVVLVSGKDSWKLVPTKAGASFDATSSVADAFAIGRAAGGFASILERLTVWVFPVDITARTALDQETFTAAMDDITLALRKPPVDSRVVVKDGQFTVTAPKPGRELLRARANRETLAAFSRAKNRLVGLRVVEKNPGVGEAQAEAAATVARVMVSKPATVTYGSENWRLTPAQLLGALQFGIVPAARVNDPAALVPVSGAGPATSSVEATVPVALGVYFSAAQLAKALGHGLSTLGRPARDARFDTVDGNVTIIPSQVGLGPDIKALARDLTGTLRSGHVARAATMRLGQTVPALTTEKARAMGIKERLSTFSTDFDPDNKPRVNNIRTLAKAIDGSLIPPGGTWSLNGKVGERTAAKGYSEANAIVNGKLVPQLGGGICQVATTVFNAIFFSGEPVVERQNHSFYIKHYPLGRDATVNWGGTDLRFRNDTSSWILIKTNTKTASVVVSLYGTSPRYTVSYTTGPLKQTTTGYPTDTIENPDLPVGVKAVKDPGEPGYRVVVTRLVRRNGTLVRKDAFLSDYSPKVEILIVGTKPVPKPTGAATTTKTAGN
jgi:vancomycin resistance protein YoaR